MELAAPVKVAVGGLVAVVTVVPVALVVLGRPDAEVAGHALTVTVTTEEVPGEYLVVVAMVEVLEYSDDDEM